MTLDAYMLADLVGDLETALSRLPAGPWWRPAAARPAVASRVRARRSRRAASAAARFPIVSIGGRPVAEAASAEIADFIVRLHAIAGELGDYVTAMEDLEHQVSDASGWEEIAARQEARADGLDKENERLAEALERMEAEMETLANQCERLEREAKRSAMEGIDAED